MAIIPADSPGDIISETGGTSEAVHVADRVALAVLHETVSAEAADVAASAGVTVARTFQGW